MLQAVKVKPFSHMAAYISAQILHSAHFNSNKKICSIAQGHDPGILRLLIYCNRDQYKHITHGKWMIDREKEQYVYINQI